MSPRHALGTVSPVSAGGSNDRRRRFAHILHALSRGLRRELSDQLRPLGVDVREWTTLQFIDDRPMSSNAELSRRLGVTPQAVHTVVLELEARKLIVRKPDPNHGRIARFVLTESGRSLLQAANAVADRVERSLLAGLGPVEQRALLASVVAMLRRMEGIDEAASGKQARMAGPR